jgi:hypothetical protein
MLELKPNTQFGILEIEVAKTAIHPGPEFILFTVDRSGSMSDVCVDRNTKLFHIKATLIKMIEYFAQHPEANITIGVVAFDDRMDTVISPTRVTVDNMSDLIASVNGLDARNTTNIEMALRAAATTMANYTDENPGINMKMVSHIFMTDGDATDGVTAPDVLKSLIDDRYRNIFIGYGTQHNTYMLQIFGDRARAEYRFIDSCEKTGLVYGEVLHRILFAAIEDVAITVKNGEIYDWKKNAWSNIIVEDVFDSEVKKTFQVRTDNPHIMSATIRGIIGGGPMVDLETAEVLPQLMDGQTGEDVPDDLTKYMYRQLTQQVLYRCRNLYENSGKAHNELKAEMSGLFRKLRGYMQKADKMTDHFLMVLCEDISVAYRSLGTSSGRMYSSARQGSQGRQDTYTSRYSPEVEPIANPGFIPRQGTLGRTNSVLETQPPLRRCNAMSTVPEVPYWQLPDPEVVQQLAVDFGDLDQYIRNTAGNEPVAEYAYASSSSRTQMMRAMSGGSQITETDV